MRARYARLAAALLAVTLLAPSPSRASVDLTGSWTVVVSSIIGPLTSLWTVTQVGTQLTITYVFEGGSPLGPYTGTIDPDLGTFHVPLPDSTSNPPGFVCTGNGITGVATLDGQTISGTWVSKFFKITPPAGCFDGGGPFAGTRDACGNGIPEASEACDDGNQDGGDCCAADCQTLAPDGTACDDGDPCTPSDQCGAGMCYGTTPSCAPAGPGGKSKLALRADPLAPAKSKLSWQWSGSGPLPLEDLGDPLAATGYTLCVLDHPGGTPTVRFHRTAPAGGTCGTKACWGARGPGYRYRDRDGTPEGVTAMSLRAATAGPGRVRMKGKGALLALPALGLTPPVVARLVRSDAPVCWEATYSTPTDNGAGSFRASSD
jgi:hypothetical protein